MCARANVFAPPTRNHLWWSSSSSSTESMASEARSRRASTAGRRGAARSRSPVARGAMRTFVTLKFEFAHLKAIDLWHTGAARQCGVECALVCTSVRAVRDAKNLNWYIRMTLHHRGSKPGAGAARQCGVKCALVLHKCSRSVTLKIRIGCSDSALRRGDKRTFGRHGDRRRRRRRSPMIVVDPTSPMLDAPRSALDHVRRRSVDPHSLSTGRAECYSSLKIFGAAS